MYLAGDVSISTHKPTNQYLSFATDHGYCLFVKMT